MLSGTAGDGTPAERAARETDVASAYNAWARSYDRDANRTRDLAAAVLQQASLPLPGARVVEIGGGTGANTEWLAEQAGSVLALDFSEGMLRRARERLRSSRVCFVRHDVRLRWPVSDAWADLVIVRLVLERVEHLPPVFADMSRVLRPGGEALVCELHPARQREGRQAEFTHPGSGEHVRIAAFLHDTADYLAAAAGAGLRVMRVDDGRGPDASPEATPRVLALRLSRSADG